MAVVKGAMPSYGGGGEYCKLVQGSVRFERSFGERPLFSSRLWGGGQSESEARAISQGERSDWVSWGFSCTSEAATGGNSTASFSGGDGYPAASSSESSAS